MQYILTKEEFDNLVSKQELDEANELLDAVVNVFRNSDLCNKHKYKNAYCDDCPIANLNIRTTRKICKDRNFSK